MLAVLASRHDEAAAGLVERWDAADAVLLTAAALSQPGWRYVVGDARTSTGRIGERVFASEELTGVLVRLPAVTEAELPHIDPAERAYVAQEMTAFLLSWLSDLPCTVLNRPVAPALTSPLWSDQKWACVARGQDVAAHPARTSVRFGDGERSGSPPVDDGASWPTSTVTVVGDRCLDDTADVAEPALRLARAAGVDLLALRFRGLGPNARFAAADPWVDISNPAVADAVLELLSSGRPRRPAPS